MVVLIVRSSQGRLPGLKSLLYSWVPYKACQMASCAGKWIDTTYQLLWGSQHGELR